MQPFIKVCRV